MSHTVFARKYRPSNFLELVGQDYLVKTLSNAIVYKKMHHAFILTGIRGIGKTTTARIIAKTLNCTQSSVVNGVIIPCDVCENCVAMRNGSHPDIIEFDAASNTGIDDIKSITETIAYNSIMGAYRVFIIDEVHMLSNKAFNSILKTLEEPPANVVFIFATTEIQKVPVTILSRCQKFLLTPLLPEQMVIHLENISHKESLNIENGVLQLIAEKSGGSVRDAISLLEQSFIVNYNSQITLTSVKNIVGFISDLDIEFIFNAILKCNASDIITKVDEVLRCGVNEAVLLEYFMDFLYKKINQSISTKESCSSFIRLWNVFLNSTNDIVYAYNKSQALKMIFIKAVYIFSVPSVENVLYSVLNNDIAGVVKSFPRSHIEKI